MLHLTYDNNLDTNTSFTDMKAKTDQYTLRLRDIVASGAYTEYESSACLPSDDELLKQVQQVAAEKLQGDALRYHVVIGIGGSNLGTKAVYDALYGATDVLEPTRFPKLLFAETTDSEWLIKVQTLLQTLDTPEQFLISVVSKSGGTTETLANFEIIMGALAAKFDNPLQRVVAITDEGSALWEQAGAQNITRLALQIPVGGRYSVLSAVGLFPLLTVGIDIVALREGATAMRDQCLTGETNGAAISARLLAYYKSQGKTINDNFFFRPQLESLGKWYRQLMGESVGKAQSLDGQVVHTGITPTVSLGSTDLHSVGQLYLGGPKDKITTFVYSVPAQAAQVPTKRVFPGLIPIITGTSATDILDAILQGVKIAYQKAELPFMGITLDAIDAQTLGAFLQFKMLEMMYLSQLLNVNSFDQPSVESYKIETKAILEANR